MPLCVEEKHKVLTDFGYEYEVSAHADVAPGRVRALDDLYQGKLLREANRFVFNIGFGGDAPADGGDADGDAGGDGEAE